MPFTTVSQLLTEEIRNVLIVQELLQLLSHVLSSANDEFVSRLLIDEGRDEGPQDGEDTRSTHHEHLTHRLRVVRLKYAQ